MKLNLYTCLLIATIVLVTGSCKKLFPKDLDSIDSAAKFNSTYYEGILGRKTIYRDQFSFGESTTPLKFEIINIRRANGEKAPELSDSIYKVTAWKTDGVGPYTGEEKSIAEIENKRTIENHRLFEIRDYSPDFLIWDIQNPSNINTAPNAGYLFDVKVSNSGSVRYFYDMRFVPFKAMPFEPNNYDRYTGMASSPVLTSGVSGIGLENIYQASDKAVMPASNVNVKFTKLSDKENSLTFKFLDSAYNPIDPNEFSSTNWEGLVHGFNMRKTNTEVKYDVAYPVPLVNKPTKYTNLAGNRAHVEFTYNRNVMNTTLKAKLKFDFAIYQKGEWEIAFLFRNTSPKFTDD